MLITPPVRAVEYRGGAAHDLDPVGQHRLVGVGDGMAHQPHVLGMPVDEHQQSRRGASRRSAADAAQGHLPRRAARNAVAHQAASGDEQPRDLLGQRRQQRRLETLLDFLPVDDGNGHRKMPDVGFMPGSRDHHLADRIDFFLAQAVGVLGTYGAHGGNAAEQQHQNQFRPHFLAFYILDNE